MVDLIQNTNFSIQFVLDKINANEAESQKKEQQREKQQQQLSPLISQLEGFEAKNISEGSAFLSIILRLTLHWKEPRGDLPSSIIMKVPGPQHKHLKGQTGGGDQQREEDDPTEDLGVYEFLITAHQREIQFYEHFARLDPGLRLPKYYFGSPYHPSHRDGLILMEDLTPRGVTVPVLPGLGDAQVRELLSEVARLHATSWLHPEWQQRVGSEQIRDDFIEGMRQNALKMRQLDPVVFGPLVDPLLSIFTAHHCAMSNYTEPKFGFPPCLLHADLWTANVLWEKDERGRATDRLCAIIDWQCVHAGNPCEDILRILSLNTPGEYRRANTDSLLEFYAQEVARWMDGKAPFSMEQLKEAYVHALPYSMMYFCFGAPYYHDMDSVVGVEPGIRKQNQQELLNRGRMFLEDTLSALEQGRLDDAAAI